MYLQGFTPSYKDPFKSQPSSFDHDVTVSLKQEIAHEMMYVFFRNLRQLQLVTSWRRSVCRMQIFHQELAAMYIYKNIVYTIMALLAIQPQQVELVDRYGGYHFQTAA